jgi:hypothetical protein
VTGEDGTDGVLERVESGDERVEFSPPSGMEDKGLEGGIVTG